jgi:putative DNA-invertase from lambdoid prophage Rac
MAATQGIDTDARNPASRMMLHILGAVAEFERGIIVERVHAGVRQYAASYKSGRIGKDKHSKSGKDLAHGRPKKIFDRAEVVRLRALQPPMSFRKIAAQLGIPLTTIVRSMETSC